MKTFKHSSQRGFTLIELMIAMLLGVFLTAGIIQIFISSKQAYRLQENISRLQENGRFAMDFLTKGVRMAGYTGCSSSSTSTTNMVDLTTQRMKNTNVTSVNFFPIAGNNNVPNNWNDKACKDGTIYECIADTDVIRFMSSGSCNGQLVEKMQTGAGQSSDTADLKIDANNSCDIEADEIVIVSDCSSTDIFAATTASNIDNGPGNKKTQNITHTQAVNTGNRLSKAYGQDAEIFAPKLMSYFIRSGAGGIPALWRLDSTDAGSEPEELIEGIENMQVLYGVDTDLGTTDCPATPPAKDKAGCYVPNYYVATPANWDQVVSVRVSLLAVSIENNLIDDPQGYTYNDQTLSGYTRNKNTLCSSSSGKVPCIYVRSKDTSQICPPSNTTGCIQVDDLRLRRVFSSTIVLRNRVP